MTSNQDNSAPMPIGDTVMGRLSPHPLQHSVPDPIKTQHQSPEFVRDKFLNILLWKKRPHHGDGVLEPNSLHNILAYLRHHPKYAGLFRYDRFQGRVIVYKCPPWEDERKFKVRNLSNTDTTYITALLECEEGKLCPTASKVRECIEVMAFENWINPPLEYFESLRWDGEKRLYRWLEVYLGANGDQEYLSAVGMCWMIAGAARIYMPGCRAENMIVFEGPQGELKSTALRKLATLGSKGDEESYFCDTLTFSDIQKKDTTLKLCGKLIVEFPELAKLGHKEVEEVKQWMSIQDDEMRRPYGRETEKFPRQFILAGTTNEQFWLKDKTGNRRYWPVKVGSIDLASLSRDVPQLWAEAVFLFKSGEQWWLNKSSEVWKKAEIEQAIRLADDIWITPIERYLENTDKVTVDEILEKIGVDVSKREEKHANRIRDILRRIGFEQKTKWDKDAKKNKHTWIRKKKQEILKIEKEPEYEEVNF